MSLDDLMGDGQTKTGSATLLSIVRAILLDPVESVEQMR